MSSVAPPCLGEAVCGHWRGEHLGGLFSESVTSMFSSKTRLTHGDNPEHSRMFEAGVMPDGLCDAGHDRALEAWMHAVMARVGCAPLTPPVEVKEPQ